MEKNLEIGTQVSKLNKFQNLIVKQSEWYFILKGEMEFISHLTKLIVVNVY